MKNHDASTAPASTAPPGSSFGRAFFKGASSGALMMGIFSAVMLAGSFILPPLGLAVVAPTITSALTMVGLGSLSTGLFSAITASSRAASAPSYAPSAHVARERWSGPEQSYVPVPVAAPMLADAVDAPAPSTQWRDHAEHSRVARENISDILARGDMTAKDRAAAILSAREQSSTLETVR